MPLWILQKEITHSGAYEGYLQPVSEGNFFPKHFLLSMSFLNKTKEAKKNVQYQYYVQAATILVTAQPILAVTKPRNNFLKCFLQL